MPIEELESTAKLKEKMLFIKKFVTEPRTIGSVTPSSPQLVASMLANVNWAQVRSVAEFGAGTGVMTREIIKRKAPKCELMVFEIDNELRRQLSKETGLEIYDDATKICDTLTQKGIEKVDLIVSSLPYTVLPREVTKAVLDGIERTLDKNGTLVAFQYSLHMKCAFESLFHKVNIRFVMMNIPPAFVYECKALRRG